MLLNKGVNVGVFRPIINSKIKKDKNLDLLLTHFKLNLDYENSFSYSKSEILALLNNNKQDEIIETIIKQYKQLQKQFDFIVCEGTDFIGEGASQEFDLNVEIAKNLGIPILLVGTAENKNLLETLSNIQR
jgi:phosphate acetyltransferase